MLFYLILSYLSLVLRVIMTLYRQRNYFYVAFFILYVGWQWRHFVRNSYRRHVEGMQCCSSKL